MLRQVSKDQFNSFKNSFDRLEYKRKTNINDYEVAQYFDNEKLVCQETMIPPSWSFNQIEWRKMGFDGLAKKGLCVMENWIFEVAV